MIFAEYLIIELVRTIKNLVKFGKLSLFDITFFIAIKIMIFIRSGKNIKVIKIYIIP